MSFVNWQVMLKYNNQLPSRFRADKAANYLKVTLTVRQGFKPLPQS